jgi:hypothetical protein
MYNNPFPHVPSASKIHRILACPGSHQAELAAPEVEEETTEADHGNEVHAILAGELDEDKASADVVQTAEMCNDQVSSLLSEWGRDVDHWLSEKRYAMVYDGKEHRVVEAKQGLLAKVVFTGQFDRLYISGAHGLLIDFKSLRGDHASAIENPQLMSLAVLVAKKHKLETVRVALVQPLKGKPTTADFTLEGLKKAEPWLLDAFEAERNAGPDDRRAGKWCTYCKAQPGCWAWKKHAERARDTKLVPTDSLLAQTMSPQDVAEFDAFCSHVITQAKRGKAWVQALVLQDPSRYASHFTTDTTEGRATITDLSTVWQRVEQDGIPHDKFLACLTARKDDSKATGLPGLKGEIRRALKLKGRALDNKLDAVLDGCITEGKKKTIAVRIGADSIEDGDGQLE